MQGSARHYGSRVTSAKAPGTGTLVSRALRRRCPHCGSKGIFTSWFRMAERCPNCGLATDRVVGHWIGAVGMNTIITFGVLFVVLAIGLIGSYPEIDPLPILVIAVVTALVVPLLAWPYSQTLWTAVDIVMRPVTPDELDPRFLGR